MFGAQRLVRGKSTRGTTPGPGLVAQKTIIKHVGSAKNAPEKTERPENHVHPDFIDSATQCHIFRAKGIPARRDWARDFEARNQSIMYNVHAPLALTQNIRCLSKRTL